MLGSLGASRVVGQVYCSDRIRWTVELEDLRTKQLSIRRFGAVLGRASSEGDVYG